MYFQGYSTQHSVSKLLNNFKVVFPVRLSGFPFKLSLIKKNKKIFLINK